MTQPEHKYWVYILSNRSHTLYIGVTNALRARLAQHREQTPGTHTARYNISRLVYFEFYQYIRSAIAREKELKHWTRAQKVASSSPPTQPGKNSCPKNTTPTPQQRTQIPFGNDRQKGKDNQHCSS